MIMISRLKSAAAICAVIAVAVSCTTVKTTKAPAGKAAYGEYGLSLDWFDKSVKPGDDFYLYGVGTWDQATPIPEDRSSYGIETIIGDQVENDLHAIAESAAAGNAPEGSPERKVGDFYASYMDEAAIEAKGLAPLQPRLDTIAAITTRGRPRRGLRRRPSRASASLPSASTSTPTTKKPDIYSALSLPVGLRPSRPRLLSRSATREYENYRAAYRAYIETDADLAGDRRGAAATRRRSSSSRREIARAHWPAEDARDATRPTTP